MTNTVTCRKCGARNRLKASAGGATPVCGRCGTPLVETIEISSAAGGPAAAAPARGVGRAKLSNAQVLVVIGVVALALTGMAELLLLMLY
jgi:hypothetical protein